MTLKRRVERLEREERRRIAANRDIRSPLDPRVEEATRDTYTWVTKYTKTYNDNWLEEKRTSAYEPFPGIIERPYLPLVFELLESDERIIWFEKSRDMMLSWTCVAYFTLNAMKIAQRGVLFQTQKEAKVKELVQYSKCLYEHQPRWLRDAFPLAKPLRSQSDLSLQFAHGGRIVGIPGGANQIRSYHPWGYLNDESSFQPDAGECYNEALSAAKGKIIFNSSAGPGWYADARHDIIRTSEDR